MLENKGLICYKCVNDNCIRKNVPSQNLGEWSRLGQSEMGFISTPPPPWVSAESMVKRDKDKSIAPLKKVSLHSWLNVENQKCIKYMIV